MGILAALLVLNVAAFVMPAEQLDCTDTVQCPCGSTGKNVTVCAVDAKDDLCSRWSKCLTCQDGLDRCLECIDDRDNGSCSPETVQPKLSRQKRQGYNRWANPRRPSSSRYQQRPNQGYPTGPVQQGGGFCPELNSPKLGSIRCMSTNRVRTCVGRCLPGYSFEDHGPEFEMTTSCSNGYYAPLRKFPPCQSGGYCDLVVQGPGSFNCTTGMDGTRCDIICSGNYVGRFFCYPGRPWQPPLPQCMKPKVVESSCTCEYGGRCDSYGNCVCPVGRTGRNCETIVAEKQTCSDPGFVTNGFRRNPDESDASARQIFDEGESVVYGCTSEEYALQGSSLLTCKSDGTWSKPLPKCIKTVVSPDRTLAFCRDPGPPANGIRRPQPPSNRRGYPQGSQLSYSCNSGYDLEGEKSLFCLVSGRWSSERPKCNTQYREPEVVENYCPNPGPISNGKIAYSPPINSRRMGQSPTDPEFPEGGRLQYSCNTGYFIEGTITLTCLPDGGWSAPAPSCSKELTYCPNPGAIPNGKIVYHPPLNSRRRGQGSSQLDDPEFPEGGRLHYTCDRDYVMQGAESLTCKPNGRWSAPAPSCGKVVTYCPNPGRIINGKIEYYPPLNSRRRGQGSAELDDPEFPEGGRLEYTCDRDYVMEGTESLTCQSNGRWSASPPSCGQELTYCPNPGAISNGKIAYHPPLNSRSKGQGSAQLDDPEFPEGGRLQYICDRSYLLEGAESLTCQPNGRWSAPPPSCSRALQGETQVYCPVLDTFPNGKSSTQSTVNPKLGWPAGTRIEFSCYQGMDMEGENSLYCFRSGKWSSQMPRCKPRFQEPEDNLYCPNPGPVENGRMMYYPTYIRERKKLPPQRELDDLEFPPGGSMEYVCDPGYALNGRAAITCRGEDGEWDAEPPTCTEASSPARASYCYNPGPVPNGRVVPFVPSSRNRPGDQDETYEEYPRGTRLQYSCDKGYSLQGASNITCGARGRWSTYPPICITTDPRNMQYCVNPGPILNGDIRYFNSMANARTGSTSLVAEDTPEYPEGTRLEYRCGDGYIMEGAFQLKCLSTGQWSDFPPKCIADCGRSVMGTTRRILYGNKTIVGEWPWVVAIGIRQNNFTRLICGGAVLNTQTIVTAAHCLVEANQFVLYFGKYHRSDSEDDAQVLVRTSNRIIMHPEYSNATMDNDIALVKFKPKINFTDRVQPICLPSAESTTYNLVSGRNGYVTGWGTTEKRLSADELLVAKLPYVSNNDCIDSFRRNIENFNGSLTQNMFCAGYKEGRSQSTCMGDSGAPFVFYDTLVERYTLEGLVSFGIEAQCGLPGMYSVFTKVYRFLPWIYRNL